VREIQELGEPVLHEEQPHHYAQDELGVGYRLQLAPEQRV
jgi:hypothetical protein